MVLFKEYYSCLKDLLFSPIVLDGEVSVKKERKKERKKETVRRVSKRVERKERKEVRNGNELKIKNLQIVFAQLILSLKLIHCLCILGLRLSTESRAQNLQFTFASMTNNNLINATNDIIPDFGLY